VLGLGLGVGVKVTAGIVALAGIGTTVVLVSQPAAPTTAPAATTARAVVSRVVDGDTFDAAIDGRVERIRMLNIDTPETKDPALPVECLGLEASAYLSSLLPVGTAVTLEYDDVRTDPYQRTLAGVFTADGTLVNAQIAGAGLAVTAVYDGNDRFYAEVEAARQSAAARGLGLYSSTTACTLPAQLAAALDATSRAPAAAAQPAEATAAQLDSAAADAATAAAAAESVSGLLGGPRTGLAFAAFSRTELDRFAAQAKDAATRTRGAETALRTAAGEATKREQDRARQAEEAAARQAEERRNAEPKGTGGKAEPEQRSGSGSAAGSKPDVSTKKSTPKPRAKAPSANPYPGYTGPRCYAPGGKTWRPC
jgi:micrococcal nuclease